MIGKVLNQDLGFKCVNSLREIMAKNNSVFANYNNPAKHQWIESGAIGNLSSAREIAAKDNDFYNSNIIARLSRILTICKNELAKTN